MLSGESHIQWIMRLRKDKRIHGWSSDRYISMLLKGYTGPHGDVDTYHWVRQLEKEWENKDLSPSAAEKALIDEYAHGEDDDFLNSLTSVKQPKSKKCVDWVRDVVDQVQMVNSWLPSLALTERRVAKSIFRGLLMRVLFFVVRSFQPATAAL